MNNLTSLWRSLKSRGVVGTVRKICYGYFEVIKFIVFYRDLRQPVVEMPSDPAFRFKQLSLAELKQWRDTVSGLPPEFYCDESYGFTTPCVGFVDGEPAAIVWIVYQGQNSRFLDIRAGDVELNYSYVLPRYRRRHLMGQLMNGLIKVCQEQQFKRLFGVVSATNIPQFKQMLECGFMPVEALTHFAWKRPRATLAYVPGRQHSAAAAEALS